MDRFIKTLGIALMLVLVLTAFAQQSPRRSSDKQVSQSDLWVGRTHYEDDLIIDNIGGNSGNNFETDNLLYIRRGTEAALPKGYVLYGNYPNPFNPSTTIKYTIPEKGFVTLEVYNIIGQSVGTLENKLKEAGTYEVVFDAGDLSAGLYFCRISVNNFTAVKRMALVK